MKNRTTRSRVRRVLRTATIITAATALAVPGVAWASHVFNDVSDRDFYASAVTWAKDNGITAGCNPSEGNTKFCPDDTVTRGVMAIFLRNLAESQAVDAGTLQGKSSSDFLLKTAKAADADKLDGLDSTAFLRSTATAADANLLDGLDSTAFLGATAKAADADLLDGIDSSQLRHISISMLAMFPEGGATLHASSGGNSGVRMPNSGTPTVAVSFTLPADYETGTPLTFTLNVFHLGPVSTPCSFRHRPNYISVGTVGEPFAPISTNAFIGSEVVSFDEGNSIQQHTFIVDPPGVEMEAGDSLVLGMFRQAVDAQDTCTSNLVIHGAQITY